MSRFISPDIHCENEWGKMRFGVVPTQKQKDDFFAQCKKDYSEGIQKFNQQMYGVDPFLGPAIPKPKPAIRPQPVEMPMPKPPKVELNEVPVKKDGKLDTNQLLLLGLGAIIIILLIKK